MVAVSALVLPARLLSGDVPAFWPQAQAALAPCTGECRVDASALTQFDSSALAMLLALRREAQARGCALVWHGATGRLADLAALYGIDGLLSPRLASDRQIA
jgi:phospholipid transport system transporter-binding protein